MTTLLSFPAPGLPWTSAERRLLDQMGKMVGRATQCECGISDEGDPWIVFCDADSSFIAHVARIGARYLVVWADGTSVHGVSLDRLLSSARRRHAVAA